MSSPRQRIIESMAKYFRKNSDQSVKPLRREEYDHNYRMSLREWLIQHQKEIVYESMTWMGMKIWKNPLDAWIYQEILNEVRPEVVVEIGSQYGGSTRYFADLLELMGKGMVISIDPYRNEYALSHKRVLALTGKSSDRDILAQVEERCKGQSVFVIQDGNHNRAQVLEDLESYSQFVSVGSYFVVEDGIVDLFHTEDGLGFGEEKPGPLAATEEFLRHHPEFISDMSRERYILTYNPKGFLKRISP